MDHPPKRKPRFPTGVGRGGKRDGAGRPKGALNALPLGTVKAVKALRWRVPEGTDEELAACADEAFSKLVAVMREEVDGFAAANVLKAATLIRTEVCGPIAQKVDLAGTLSVEIQINRAVKPKELPAHVQESPLLDG